MKQPKRTKYKYKHKRNRRGLSKAGNFVSFGSYGLMVLDRGDITARQLECVRVAIQRACGRNKAKTYFRIFPDTPRTRKPAEVRMGKGKGSIDRWVAEVRPGKIIVEIDGVDKDTAKKAFGLCSDKLNLKVKLVERVEVV